MKNGWKNSKEIMTYCYWKNIFRDKVAEIKNVKGREWNFARYWRKISFFKNRIFPKSQQNR